MFLLLNPFWGINCLKKKKTETWKTPRKSELLPNMSQTSIIACRGPLCKCRHICMWVFLMIIFIESGFIDEGESGGASLHFLLSAYMFFCICGQVFCGHVFVDTSSWICGHVFVDLWTCLCGHVFVHLWTCLREFVYMSCGFVDTSSWICGQVFVDLWTGLCGFVDTNHKIWVIL